jgi:WD40 repeat protein
MWDIASGKAHGTLMDNTSPVSALACTLLGGRPVAVAGSADRTVRLWDLTSQRQDAVTTLPDAVNTLAITSGGDLIVGFGWEICAFRPFGRRETT